MLKIGSHMDMKAPEYLLGVVRKSIENDANAFMIYTGAPQNTVRKDVSLFHIEEAHELMRKHGIELTSMIIHAPYIINLANVENPATYELAVRVLKDEIIRTSKLGASYLVLHPGSALKAGVEAGISSIIRGLNEAVGENCPITVLLETMAGKGSEVGRSFEELAAILKGVNYPEHFGVCMDTCHLNDAGYDLRNFDNVLSEFDSIIGLSKLKVIHVNDSKNVRGAMKDRHENIGFGEIGFDILCSIVHHPLLTDVVKILETPYVDRSIAPYKKEIAMLKSRQFDSNWIELEREALK